MLAARVIAAASFWPFELLAAIARFSYLAGDGHS